MYELSNRIPVNIFINSLDFFQLPAVKAVAVMVAHQQLVVSPVIENLAEHLAVEKDAAVLAVAAEKKQNYSIESFVVIQN